MVVTIFRKIPTLVYVFAAVVVFFSLVEVLPSGHAHYPHPAVHKMLEQPGFEDQTWSAGHIQKLYYYAHGHFVLDKRLLCRVGSGHIPWTYLHFRKGQPCSYGTVLNNFARFHRRLVDPFVTPVCPTTFPLEQCPAGSDP